MDNKEKVLKIIELVGDKENILSAENCMTRLRFNLKDYSLVKVDDLKALEDVLGLVNKDGLQIIVGPGKAKKLMDLIHSELGDSETSENNPIDWQENKEKIKSRTKDSKVKGILKSVSNIFVPLIPAIIAAGLFSGIAGLLTNMMSTGAIPADNQTANIFTKFFALIGGSFMTYLFIYVGINSAKVFGATQALGGMIGAMVMMPDVSKLSQVLGLYNNSVPLNSILREGKGGIIAVILGVYILSIIEKFVRKYTPDVLDLIITPTITLLISAAFLVGIIMPVSGYISDGIMIIFKALISSTNPIISAISGYILAALFLPLVLVGMHHALIPIYTVQLTEMGSISLFPILAMAGAGQVGASIAIYIKSKKLGKHNLNKTILSGLPAGFLGVGEPLLYGVTLPMGKPFITGGLGAGFGGAYIAISHVTSMSYGASGLPGTLLMKPECMVNYLLGILIGIICGFILSYIFVNKKDFEKIAD